MKDTQIADPGRPEGKDGVALIKRMNGSHAPLREWAFAKLKWRCEMNILDVGCGGGETINEMERLAPGSKLYGMDHSKDCVAYASENCPDAEIISGDVAKLPYDDDIFDLVTAVETVYFWKEINRAFKEIYRCLKKGGLFAVICEADGPERFNMSEINFKFMPYTPDELVGLMKESGFTSTIPYVKGNGYMMITGKK